MPAVWAIRSGAFGKSDLGLDYPAIAIEDNLGRISGLVRHQSVEQRVLFINNVISHLREHVSNLDPGIVRSPATGHRR